jgi:hypothetical protein
MMLAEPFAETLEPRCERGLVGRWSMAIALVAWVGHGFDTRDSSGEIAAPAAPQGRADHTERVKSSQETGPAR